MYHKIDDRMFYGCKERRSDHVKADSLITIDGNISRKFNHRVMELPNVIERFGSKRDPIVYWKEKGSDVWTTQPPKEIGTYEVYAELPEDEQHLRAESQHYEFVIGAMDLNVDVEDENFRAILQALVKNRNGIVTYEDIACVKEINLQCNVHITSLKGIEYFTALTKLDCSYTKITSLDLRHHPALEVVECGKTKLHSLDVSNNKMLRELSCTLCEELTSLDILGAESLEKLYCGGTSIAHLDVHHHKNLTTLYCNNNDKLVTLVTKGADALTYLNCMHTGITCLDVSENKRLIELECGNTGIEKLDVRNLPQLQTLGCSHSIDNSLTMIDARGATALRELFADGNKELQSLILDDVDALDYVSLEDTYVKR